MAEEKKTITERLLPGAPGYSEWMDAMLTPSPSVKDYAGMMMSFPTEREGEIRAQAAERIEAGDVIVIVDGWARKAVSGSD